ncbi:hypothetical protein SALBM311S_01881 [Streptomyces alboniger]
MSDPARGLRGRPFTLVVCVSCQAATDRLMDELRQAVRDCPHGVMISTGFLRKVLGCAGRRGLHAVVQPAQRRSRRRDHRSASGAGGESEDKAREGFQSGERVR